jgi:transposase
MGVSKFSSEVRERSVQLVLEQEAQHKSQWQAVTSVAQKLGCHAATVLSWV